MDNNFIDFFKKGQNDAWNNTYKHMPAIDKASYIIISKLNIILAKKKHKLELTKEDLKDYKTLKNMFEEKGIWDEVCESAHGLIKTAEKIYMDTITDPNY